MGDGMLLFYTVTQALLTVGSPTVSVKTQRTSAPLAQFGIAHDGLAFFLSMTHWHNGRLSRMPL